MLSRVSTLEEGKGGPRNDTEERAKIESALTSLHQRISELEKGNGRGGGAGSLCQWDLAWGAGFLQRKPSALQPFPTLLPRTAPHAARLGLPVGVPGWTGAPGLWASPWEGSREGKGLLLSFVLPAAHTHTLTGFSQVSFA